MVQAACHRSRKGAARVVQRSLAADVARFAASFVQTGARESHGAAATKICVAIVVKAHGMDVAHVEISPWSTFEGDIMQPLKSVLVIASLVLGSLLAACATVDTEPRLAYGYGPPTGVVEGIDYVPHQPHPSGAGAIVGGVAGGVLGHQIGSGTGNTVATIVGAIGGALVGDEIERRSRRNDEDFRVGVRMDDGSYRVFVTEDTPDLRIGDRVTVEGEHIYRY
jgi:outer membrane lipoprotein SlyB